MAAAQALRTAGLAMALAVAVAACGRSGGGEPPPERGDRAVARDQRQGLRALEQRKAGGHQPTIPNRRHAAPRGARMRHHGQNRGAGARSGARRELPTVGCQRHRPLHERTPAQLVEPDQKLALHHAVHPQRP